MPLADYFTFTGKRKSPEETMDHSTASGAPKRTKITTTKQVGNIINWSVPATEGITALEAEPFTQFDFSGEDSSTWQFYIKCIPASGNKRWFGVFLRCIQLPECENDANYYATFTATIVHPTDPAQNIFHNGKSQPMNPAQKKSWGNMLHVNSDTLKALIHPDKTLSVVLEFWLFKEYVEAADVKEQELIADRKELSTKNFLGDLYRESFSPEFSDTKIKLRDEKIIHTHSFLLAARSRMLRDALLKEGRKGRHGYELTFDISEKTMRAIICHISHGCLIENLLDPSQLPEDLFAELIQAAHDFGLGDLLRFLEFRKKSSENETAEGTQAGAV